MLFSTVSILATLVPALAAASQHSPPPAFRHKRLASLSEARDIAAGPAPRANIAHAEAHRAVRKAIRKRDGATCRPKPSASPSPAAEPAPSQSPSPSPAAPDNQQAWAQQSSAAPSPSPSPADQNNNWSSGNNNNGGGNNNNSGGGGGGSGVSVNVNVGGLLQLNTGSCGWCNSNDQQPNGSEDWLNCGLNGGGWQPPFVSCSELIAADLDASGVFAPCGPYIDKFNQYGGEFGVAPIMLASFAMQESTCNAGATGANGEAGLMQIAGPNCEAGQNCWDPDYNIRRGAQLFSQMVDSQGGNCIAAMGAYNGWYVGMTQGDVYGAASCHAQQNMDYLFQFVNGWMQNKNAYGMGSILNLAAC